MAKLKIALEQMNPVVGDIEGNKQKIMNVIRASSKELIVFPECALSGYPIEDLALRPSFIDACYEAVLEIHDFVRSNKKGAVIFGAPLPDNKIPRDGDYAGLPYNAAVFSDPDREEPIVITKREGPNYDVFDEKRTFAFDVEVPQPVIEYQGTNLGIMICEDGWHRRVAKDLADAGADLLISINGSPFEDGKYAIREKHMLRRVKETGLPLIYVNMVGGQDELVFDGASFAVSKQGLVMRCMAFREDSGTIMFGGQFGDDLAPSMGQNNPDRLEAIYCAMVLGMRDYVNKNGFSGVVIGLSGGVDSALTHVAAIDALGPERVRGVRLPSPYTSDMSNDDAAEMSKRVGSRIDTIDIGPLYSCASEAVDALGTFMPVDFEQPDLPDARDGNGVGVTYENMQARIRGLLLMALSNKYGDMLVTTGNKSEMSVGYATIYGDMCGGYSVLKDVYKTDVFALCRWRNKNVPWIVGEIFDKLDIIPDNIITRPPSAELAENQVDTNSLPPYDVLDEMLRCFIEYEFSLEETVAAIKGRFGSEYVDEVPRIRRLLDLAEYKRRQAPPGVKITSRSFGKGRRWPITMKFAEKYPV